MIRKLALALALLLSTAALAQESYVIVPPDSTGKKLRFFQQSVNGQTVYLQGYFLSNTAGNEVGLVASPLFLRLTDGSAAYDAARSTQLPSALVSGRLDVNVGNTPAVTISGTPTVTVGNGSIAVTGAFWQATQPVSAASLPLPTGAATDASVTGLEVAQNSTTSGQTGPLAQGAVTTGAPTYTTAKTSPLSLTTAGALRTDSSAVTQPISCSNCSGTITTTATQSSGANLHVNVDSAPTTAITCSNCTGTVTVTDQQTNVTADYDSGAGTQALTMFGVALPKSGGSVAGGTSTDPIRIDPTGTTTQPVSGTVATTPPSNASTNINQVGGTAIDTNSGTKSLGTQRIVIATDQPQLTNALKVDGSAVTQPVSGTVNTTPPSNASANITQANGTTLDTNSGTKSAGTIRVVLATDQPALTNKILVTPDSVALPANQSVNDNQIGGTAILTGNGATGAGSQRVTVSSDNTAFGVKPTDGTTTITVKAASTAAAAADTAQVVAQSPNGANLCVNPSVTMTSTVVSLSGTTSTQIIALSGSTKIYVCSMIVGWGGGTSPTFALRYGTGTACATGTTTIYPATTITASAPNTGNLPMNPYFVTPGGQALCYILTGTSPTGTLILNTVQQ